MKLTTLDNVYALIIETHHNNNTMMTMITTDHLYQLNDEDDKIDRQTID